MHSFELKSLDRRGVGIGFPLGPPSRPRPHNHCQRYPEAMAGFSLNHRPRRGEAADHFIFRFELEIAARGPRAQRSFRFQARTPPRSRNGAEPPVSRYPPTA
jgi:hypothetical protein